MHVHICDAGAFVQHSRNMCTYKSFYLADAREHLEYLQTLPTAGYYGFALDIRIYPWDRCCMHDLRQE